MCLSAGAGAAEGVDKQAAPAGCAPRHRGPHPDHLVAHDCHHCRAPGLQAPRWQPRPGLPGKQLLTLYYLTLNQYSLFQTNMKNKANPTEEYSTFFCLFENKQKNVTLSAATCLVSCRTVTATCTVSWQNSLPAALQAVQLHCQLYCKLSKFPGTCTVRCQTLTGSCTVKLSTDSITASCIECCSLGGYCPACVAAHGHMQCVLLALHCLLSRGFWCGPQALQGLTLAYLLLDHASVQAHVQSKPPTLEECEGRQLCEDGGFLK